MSVEKFRSIQEMSAAPARVGRGGEANDHFERFVRHCARFWLAAARMYPRGVFKFRSMDEAQRRRIHNL